MTYSQFVTSRVKWLETSAQDLAHSAMGLLGESIELEHTTGEKNTREELGDLEFYKEHAEQALGKARAQFPFTPEPINVSRQATRDIEAAPEFSLRFYCAQFHDLAKKAWIYNKPLGDLNFEEPLVYIGLCLHFLAQKNGTTREALQAENQAKLEKRYPTGYSDQAAQQRADKAAGE